MEKKFEILGKVSITAEGNWDKNKEYKKLSMVYDDLNRKSYISKKDVPIGTSLENINYWQLVSESSKMDNNYSDLVNKPSINGRVLEGNKTLEDLNIPTEKFILENDNKLQSQIDALVNRSDVVDVVANKNTLNKYDKSSITENDVVKILRDESRNNEITYYRLVNNNWVFIGSVGEYYTKAEADEKFQEKLNSGVTIKTINGESILGLGNIEIKSGGSETNDYKKLINKPSINNIILDGNKTIEELGLQPSGNYDTIENVDSKLNNKVDKVIGKQLSDENFTTSYKNKIDNLQENLISSEDTTIKENKVFISDRDNTKGMAYKILRLNSNGNNILSPDVLSNPNTIYEIRYDFDLNGQTVNVGENCVLNFVGGSLNNGYINFNKTIINANYPCIKCNIKGELVNNIIYTSIFNILSGINKGIKIYSREQEVDKLVWDEKAFGNIEQKEIKYKNVKLANGFEYFNTDTKKKEIYYNGIWYTEGYELNIKTSGNKEDRPVNVKDGFAFLDTSLIPPQMIYKYSSSQSGWIKADGTDADTITKNYLLLE